MQRSLEARLTALERAPLPGGPSVPYVVCFVYADEIDAARAAGDDDTAVALLARENPWVPEWELREYFLNAPVVDLSEPSDAPNVR